MIYPSKSLQFHKLSCFLIYCLNDCNWYVVSHAFVECHSRCWRHIRPLLFKECQHCVIKRKRKKRGQRLERKTCINHITLYTLCSSMFSKVGPYSKCDLGPFKEQISVRLTYYTSTSVDMLSLTLQTALI